MRGLWVRRGSGGVGFAAIATHVVWAVALFGALGAGVAAFEGRDASLLDAMEAREAFARERQEARFPGATFCHDGATLVVEARNAGRVALDAGAVTFLVDGVVVDGFSVAVEGVAGTAVWGPGERGTFSRPWPEAPAHVVARTERGAALVAAPGCP